MRSIQSKSDFSHIYNSKKPSSLNSLALIPLTNSAIKLGEECMLSVSSLLCFRAIKLLETSGNAIELRHGAKYVISFAGHRMRSGLAFAM